MEKWELADRDYIERTNTVQRLLVQSRLLEMLEDAVQTFTGILKKDQHFHRVGHCSFELQCGEWSEMIGNPKERLRIKKLEEEYARKGKKYENFNFHSPPDFARGDCLMIRMELTWDRQGSAEMGESWNSIVVSVDEQGDVRVEDEKGDYKLKYDEWRSDPQVLDQRLSDAILRHPKTHRLRGADLY